METSDLVLRMTEYLVRFIVGGFVVSAFALLGDVLRPKSFAGLFGAAPSVALATLGMAAAQHGSSYAAIQGRSMVWGAIALACYSGLVCQLLMRFGIGAFASTLACLPVWLGVALGLHAVFAGGG